MFGLRQIRASQEDQVLDKGEDRYLIFGKLQSTVTPFLNNFMGVGKSTLSGNIFTDGTTKQIDTASVNLSSTVERRREKIRGKFAASYVILFTQTGLGSAIVHFISDRQKA